MQFSVEFDETASGQCLVHDFLEDLRKSGSGNFAAIPAGLKKLQHRQYHRPPLSKPVGDAIFELLHVGKLNTPVLYFFMKGQRIVAVHAIRNKGRRNNQCDSFIAAGERYERLRREGLVVNGKLLKIQVLRPDDPLPPSDLIIVAVRQHQLNDAVRDMKMRVGPQTTIISVMNVIDSEKVIPAF